MKKSIKILKLKMDDLKETKNGGLRGGFAAVKGGFNDYAFSTNENPRGCSNTGNCVKSTNTWSCSNTGTCLM